MDFLNLDGLKYYHNTKLWPVVSGKADKATTLAGYGITNAYTKNEAQSYVSSQVTPVSTALTNLQNEVTELQEAIGNLSNIMNYLGDSKHAIQPGVTKAQITLSDDTVVTAVKGDVVTYGNQEFLFNGSDWRLYGDEGSYALNTIKINGHDLKKDFDLVASEIDLKRFQYNSTSPSGNALPQDGLSINVDEYLNTFMNAINEAFTAHEYTDTEGKYHVTYGSVKNADKATKDGLGNNISDTYATKQELADKPSTYYTYKFSNADWNGDTGVTKVVVTPYLHEDGDSTGVAQSPTSFNVGPYLYLYDHNNTGHQLSYLKLTGALEFETTGGLYVRSATASQSGVMSSSDFTKLAGIATNATADAAISNSAIDGLTWA